MPLNPPRKLHFVAAGAAESLTERLTLVLLASLLSGIGVGLFHPALAVATAGVTFLAGVLLIGAAAIYRLAAEWESRTAPSIRRTT